MSGPGGWFGVACLTFVAGGLLGFCDGERRGRQEERARLEAHRELWNVQVGCGNEPGEVFASWWYRPSLVEKFKQEKRVFSCRESWAGEGRSE